MEVFGSVSAYVRTVTNGQQVPQVISDWTSDIVLGARAAARIEYQVFASSEGRRDLSTTERNLVIRAATGFSKFRGDFIAKASLGDLPQYELTDVERENARKLGTATAFSIAYDLDRDGREEVIRIFYRQLRFVIAIETAGVTAELSNCLDDEEAQSIEVALKDFNGDRRPELWIAFETAQTTGWGIFCVLEFTGLPNLADRRREATGNIHVGFSAFRTLLRGDSGWSVAVANDNTIKACGGTGCHTSWTYTFDGQQFRLTDNQGDAPSGGAALPFRDERERAGNLFASLLRTSATLTAQPWQARMTTASTRIGNRTEVNLECSKLGDGSLFETIVVRDRQPDNAPLASEITIEPTLAYGESLPKAPVLMDGRACVLESLTRSGGQDIRLQFLQTQAGTCIGMLATANTVTLPLLHGTSLLQFRMTGAGPAISAARNACRTAALDHSTTAPAPDATLNALARRFIETYMRRSEGDPAAVVAYMRDAFASEVAYYGKQVSSQQVVEEKRRYLAQWPQRTYVLKPETIRVDCDNRQSICRIAGELDYRTSNLSRNRVAAGTASFELRVQFLPAGARIIEESGRVLARRQ
jgi:hypothetical protein